MKNLLFISILFTLIMALAACGGEETAQQADEVVDDGIRKITPEEAFKLQGFPVGNGYELPRKYNARTYPDSQLYKQAGNAVSVPVVKRLAEELLKILTDD